MCMPKVTEAQRHEKLREQLADLKAGKEVSQRKMNVALTPTQLNEIVRLRVNPLSIFVPALGASPGA